MSSKNFGFEIEPEHTECWKIYMQKKKKNNPYKRDQNYSLIVNSFANYLLSLGEKNAYTIKCQEWWDKIAIFVKNVT